MNHNADIKEKCRSNWAGEAGSYNENVNRNDLGQRNHEIWKSLIARNLPSGENLRILDVGTGPGFFAIIMAELGHTVTAVDCTKEMLDEAEKNAAESGVQITFLQGDCENLPFTEQCFDAVISRNVTWTLLDAEHTYEKWLNLLTPGGKILIFDANWNYHYHNKEYGEAHLRDCERYRKIFGKEAEHFTDEQEAYRRSVPMCKVKRPEWDISVFSGMKVKTIFCDYDISDVVWDEERKVKYRSTPMFMIAVEKKH